MCNNAQIRNDQVMGDPMEGAMLIVGHKLKLFSIRDQFVRTDERAFSSERKWMAVHVRSRAVLPTDVRNDIKIITTSLYPPPSPPPGVTCKSGHGVGSRENVKN